MKVLEKRWGEVTIKKQGDKGKNNFDETKSFSIKQTETNYSTEEYVEILKITTNLTENLGFLRLKKLLMQLNG